MSVSLWDSAYAAISAGQAQPHKGWRDAPRRRSSAVRFTALTNGLGDEHTVCRPTHRIMGWFQACKKTPSAGTPRRQRQRITGGVRVLGLALSSRRIFLTSAHERECDYGYLWSGVGSVWHRDTSWRSRAHARTEDSRPLSRALRWTLSRKGRLVSPRPLANFGEARRDCLANFVCRPEPSDAKSIHRRTSTQ